MFAEFDVVLMRLVAILEHENELVLRPVEAPLASVGLVPNYDVLQFAISISARAKRIETVPPVNEDIVNRSIFGEAAGAGHPLLRKLVNLAEVISPDARANHGDDLSTALYARDP